MAAGIFLAASATGAASADATPQYGWREFWAGADVSSNTWLIYTGSTFAPWGDIFSDGFRFRLASGYGEYTYVSTVIENGIGKKQEAKSRFTYGEALLGYHQRFGSLTAKGFAGYAVIGCNPEQPDILDIDAGAFEYSKICHGEDYGVKGAVELWLNIGDDVWSSFDTGYTTAHDTGSARWRIGYRALPTVSLGLETIYNMQDENENARAGVFARYEWFGGEISAAVGMARDYYDGAALEDNPYGNINLVIQY